MIKHKFKLDNKPFQKVIDDAIKPDTIVNIQKKYNLSFPFTVKLVKDMYKDETGELGSLKGTIVIVNKYMKNTFGLCVDHPTELKLMNADKSKKFILWG